MTVTDEKWFDKVPEEHQQNLNLIQVEEIKDFTIHILNEYGSAKDYEYANKVTDVLVSMLKHRGLYNDIQHQSFIDVMISATLLHNVFKAQSNWMNLFAPRCEWSKIATTYGLDKQVQEALFGTIEGQLGFNTPVRKCIPSQGTPTEIVADAIWFTGEFLK